MTEQEPDHVKRIHEAFRIRRENYGKLSQECRKLAQAIPNSEWKDDAAKWGIATLLSAVTLLNGRFETLEELDELVLIYAADLQNFLGNGVMPFLERMSGELDSIVGEHEKVAQTKTEVEGIAEGISKGMKKYADVLDFLENATKKSEEDQKQLMKKAEEDRKRLEKGLGYLG